MEYVIETENLTKRYVTTIVVDQVNLHVPKGKIYGLLPFQKGGFKVMALITIHSRHFGTACVFSGIVCRS